MFKRPGGSVEHRKVPRRLPLSLIPALLALAGPAATAASADVPFTATAFAASSPMGLAAGDVDGDHVPDLVTASGAHSALGVFLNDGHGAFAPGLGSPLTVTGTPANVGVGDLDGDGRADLVAPAYTDMSANPLTTAAVLLSTPSGFAAAPSSPLTTGNGPSNVTIADVDADGKPDLAIVNADDDTVSIFLGDGTGAFTPAPGGPIAIPARYLATGDFNGDGKLDLAAAETQTRAVGLLLGDGHGGFTLGATVANVNANDIATADLDGDGDLDLVVSGGGSTGAVTPLLNDGAGAFAPGTPTPLGYGISLDTGDFDADGRPDVAVVQQFSGPTVQVLLGDGHGAFATPQPITLGPSPFSILATDLDGDGRDDLALTSYGGGKVWVLRNGARPTGALDGAASRDLGDVALGARRETTFTVRSSGTAALHAGAATLTGGAGFSIARDDCSSTIVRNDAPCDITVAFAPGAAAAASATLTLPTDDQPLTATVTATGTATTTDEVSSPPGGPTATTPPAASGTPAAPAPKATPAPAGPAPSGTPKACVSRRVIVLHPSRAFLGGRVTVTMGGRTIARVARAGRTVKIDLSGRPEGVARVVLTGKGDKTQQVRRFKTCA